MRNYFLIKTEEMSLLDITEKIKKDYHFEDDMRLMRNQNIGSSNYNPISKKWRYILIDKTNSKFAMKITLPKIELYMEISKKFDKYRIELCPYAKNSPRQLYWSGIRFFRKGLRFVKKIDKSALNKDGRIIVRTVIALLITYSIWEVIKTLSIF